jgi:predicted fused transcriptional regulator/phosphomethylpyrimidine kinase
MCLWFLLVLIGVVTLFPPLKEMGEMMLNNYVLWGNKRINEIRTVADGSTPEKREEEVKKLEGRVQNFRDKMAFLANIIDVKRKHSAGSITSVGKH